MSAHLDPTKIRSRLSHPVIDADGHWIEYGPVFAEQVRKVGGNVAAEGFLSNGREVRNVLAMPLAERRRRRISQEAFWSRPEKNTRDRATGMFPRMLYDRLDELGLDFAIVYPTTGLRVPRVADEAQRRAACRAFNIVTAEYFSGLEDRMRPAAIVPMHTPDEAIEALEHAVTELGFKVAMFASLIPRPVASVTQADGEAARFAVWQDAIGLDSAYDYDPVWAKCQELKIAPTFHTGVRRSGLRVSPSNFTYNHIGHFAAANHALCKAIFLGGVTRRFPGLRFGFLEGGAGWACNLYADLIGHWEKRSRKGLEVNDPRNLDRAALARYAEQYGYGDILDELRRRDGWPFPDAHELTGGIEDLDDFAACKITRKEDWRDLFVTPFFFGCEADDPINAWAFSKGNPFGARLNAIYGSDIGHFDVPDMGDVLPEAYELVEKGLIDDVDFRDFTFANAVRLWGTQNPQFFDGTRVAKEAAALLAQPPVQTAAE